MAYKFVRRVFIITLSIVILGGLSGLPRNLNNITSLLSQTALASYLQTNNPPSTVFGIEHSIIDVNQAALLVQSGSSWLRYNSLLWSDVEGTEGAYDWTKVATLDQYLKNASEAGLEVILIVRSTPTWAQQRSGVYCGPIKSSKLNAFANFMYQAVSRYSQPPYNVKYWEIWNEPDADYDYIGNPTSAFGCWGDDQDNSGYGGGTFGQMLSYIYPRMKQADPQAQVIVGGLLLACDPNLFFPSDPTCHLQANFLRGILNYVQSGTGKPGKDFFDMVAFHAYDHYYDRFPDWYDLGGWDSESDQEGPSLIPKFEYLRGLLDQYNAQNKILINTEGALLCHPNVCEDDPPGSNFEMTKAYYVAEFFAAAIAKGLPAAIYYNFVWDNFYYSSLMDGFVDPWIKRPAYYAFNTARNTLRDSVFVQKIGSIPGMRGYVFNRGDFKIWMLWSIDHTTHTITLTEGLPDSALDVVGNPVTINPAGPSVNVNRTPIYLLWSSNAVYLPLVIR